jgi:type II secretory pathway component PulK
MILRPRQFGFALLMTLVLLVVAGALLTAVARRSIVGAVETQQAVEELQRRWAVASLQATLLGRAEELLDEVECGPIAPGAPAEGYKNKPILERRVTCQLAGRDYELVFTDEQAKLNVNALLPGSSVHQAQSAVTRVVADSGADCRAIALRPLSAGKKPAKGTARLLPIGGYGQVFEGVGPERLLGATGRDEVAAWVTCWGDGRVNLRRAPAKVVEAACTEALGRDVVGPLLAARDRDPYRKLAEILGELATLKPEIKARIGRCVTDRSECHGLWIVARGTQRSWYSLVIGVGGGAAAEPAGDAAGEQSISQRYCFSW